MTESKKLTPDEIKLRHRVVCICRAIPYGRVVDAIVQGSLSREEIKKTVGAGSGECGGTRCGPVVEDLIRQFGRAARLERDKDIKE
jgi:NAD(P)H-nitrite reductase large subunit